VGLGGHNKNRSPWSVDPSSVCRDDPPPLRWLLTYLVENAIEVGRGIRENSVGRQVPWERMGQEVPVAGQLGPRFDTDSDAPLDPVYLGEIASRDPEPLRGQADEDFTIPGGLLLREYPA